MVEARLSLATRRYHISVPIGRSTYVPTLPTPPISLHRAQCYSTLPVIKQDPASNIVDATAFDTLLSGLEYALSTKNHSLIHSSFNGFQRNASSHLPIFDFSGNEWQQFRTILIKTLDALSASAKPEDLRLVDRILVAMHNAWDMPVGPDIHNIILQNLLQHGQLTTVERWLLNMDDKPGNCVATVEHWEAFVSRCSSPEKSVKLLGNIIPWMREQGTKPREATYKLIIEGLVNGHPPPDFLLIRRLLKQMKKDGIPLSAPLFELLTTTYGSRGNIRVVVKLQQEYYTTTGSEGLEDDRDRTLAETAAGFRGRRDAIRLLRVYEAAGFEPTMTTLNSLAATVQSYEGLVFWERAMKMKANVMVFSTALRAIGDTGNLVNALETYNMARKRGHLNCAALMHPILRLYCRSKFKPPSEASLQAAIDMYQEYMHPAFEGEPITPILPDDPQIDRPIYNTLLRGLTSSPHSSKFFPVALQLLEDMQSRGIDMDSMTSTSLAIMLMRSSSSSFQAFEMYKKLYKTKGGQFTIDQKGYEAILDNFAKICVALDTTPSMKLYFEIVRDMREAGYTITSPVYTILLRQLRAYTNLRTEDDDRFKSQLRTLVRRVHKRILDETDFTPDTVLWNQLMDTYQRAGCVDEAFDLWKSLYSAEVFDNASISIVLDVCGHSNQAHKAIEVYTRLHADGFKLNQNNWHSWLECLCRVGRLSEALKIMCLEMGKKQRDVAPDEETVRMILGFASRTNQEGEVRTKVKHYLPALWEKLPIDITLR